MYLPWDGPGPAPGMGPGLGRAHALSGRAAKGPARARPGSPPAEHVGPAQARAHARGCAWPVPWKEHVSCVYIIIYLYIIFYPVYFGNGSSGILSILCILTRDLASEAQKWNVDGTRMERGWNADGTRMERGWNVDGTWMESVWNADETRTACGPQNLQHLGRQNSSHEYHAEEYYKLGTS